MQTLLPALQHYFGFPSFRAGQSEAIEHLLAGRHTLVVMPTGAGKSLVFQLSALLRQGLTLVVSPLISLMKDQVDALAQRGIAATYINSALPTAEQNARLRHLTQGRYRLVYVAPERLRSVPFLTALRSQQVSLMAVDEAHCIWISTALSAARSGSAAASATWSIGSNMKTTVPSCRCWLSTRSPSSPRIRR